MRRRRGTVLWRKRSCFRGLHNSFWAPSMHGRCKFDIRGIYIDRGWSQRIGLQHSGVSATQVLSQPSKDLFVARRSDPGRFRLADLVKVLEPRKVFFAGVKAL